MPRLCEHRSPQAISHHRCERDEWRTIRCEGGVAFSKRLSALFTACIASLEAPADDSIKRTGGRGSILSALAQVARLRFSLAWQSMKESFQCKSHEFGEALVNVGWASYPALTGKAWREKYTLCITIIEVYHFDTLPRPSANILSPSGGA